MMRRLLVLPVVLAILGASSVTALADVQSNENIPFTPTLFNPCVPETITFSGDIHLLISETASSNGGFHMIFMVNVNDLHGVSTTGTTYSDVGGAWFALTAVPPYPFESTATDVFGLISHGATANFKVIDTLHFTINADGTVTSTVTDVRISCSG